MTAPNAARDATPGQRFTDPDDGTWVRRPGAVLPWAEYDSDGVFNPRTQEEAEAAGLVLMVDPDERIAAWHQIARHAVFAACFGEDRPLIEAMVGRLHDLAAPLDPGNPEHLRTPEALRFAAAVMEEAASGRPQPATELMNARGLRDEADRLDREHADAEQEAADRQLIEVAHRVQLECGGDEFDFGMALLRAERARAEGDAK